MVEYGLIASVVALLSFSAVTLVGDETGNAFEEAAGAFDIEGADTGGGSVNSGSGDSNNGGDGGSGATTTTTTTPAPTTTQPPATTTTTEAPFDSDNDLTAGEVASELTSWTTTRRGGTGEWTATFNYENDWAAGQYLTLEVTTTDHRGRTTTTTITDFFVPAGGSASFDHEANSFREVDGTMKGVLEVQVEVTAITTQDHTGQTVTFDLDDGPVSTALAPEVP